MKAITLAKKYRLDFHEVKRVLTELEKADKNASGALDRRQFRTFLERLFERDNIPDDFVGAAFQAVSTGDLDQEMDVEGFLEWYTQNMFTAVATLSGDSRVTAGNTMVKKVAEILNILPQEVDKDQEHIR
ncbi:unnamed protein product [Polarella glacialis]|uniref:Calmodulin n=1 Tax=Polarella glacialis TaxID=89957 RepID=A0A813LDZ9_POLGL|nr:unnamed protein product [Polarella glacialis]